MSMYGLVFGGEAAASRGAVLLGVLGFKSFDDVGRYRDAWIERDPDGLMIAVYTRNGGGNREECWERDQDPVPATVDSADCTCPACKANHFLPAHEHHVRGADDDFDSTYRTEYFRVPEPYVEVLTEFAQAPVDMSQRWLDAIAAIGKSAS